MSAASYTRDYIEIDVQCGFGFSDHRGGRAAARVGLVEDEKAPKTEDRMGIRIGILKDVRL